MKNKVISTLHKLLGFENYLFVFALFIYYKLRWDKNEKDFLKIFDLINKEGVVVDIGANIGVMTAHFANKLQKSTILSFEPIPSNINTFKRVSKFFRLTNIKLFELALSDFEGETNMIMPVVGSAKKHGLSHVAEQTEGNEQGEIFQVAVNKLDNITEITQSNKPITAIKIDVEGHEFQVLKGAVNTITKYKPVIYCELWDSEQRQEIIEFVKSLNYTCKVVVDNKLCDFADQAKQNFYFIPNEFQDEGFIKMNDFCLRRDEKAKDSLVTLHYS